MRLDLEEVGLGAPRAVAVGKGKKGRPAAHMQQWWRWQRPPEWGEESQPPPPAAVTGGGGGDSLTLKWIWMPH